MLIIVIAYYTSVNGVLFSKDKTQIVIYPRGNTSTTYTLSDNVTTIGNWAFYGCSNLVDIQIPDSVTSIGDSAFASCFSLTNIKLPNKLVKISSSQFMYCSALTSISIPKSVNKIMGFVFYGCDALKDVYYPGTDDDWKKIEIGGMNDPLTNATIHYNYVVPQEPQQPAVPNEPAQPSTPSATTQTEQPSTPTQPSQSSATVQKAPKGATIISGEYVAKKQKNATIKKVKAGKKSATVSWKKVSGVTGYQIQYSTSKKFTKKTTKKVTIKKNKTVKTTIKKLKSKKKYYVRIRTYKNVKFGGKTVKVYSPWSKVKTVKVK